MILVGLGTVWILDGLEVTIVGSMSEALKPDRTGLGMRSTVRSGSVPPEGPC